MSNNSNSTAQRKRASAPRPSRIGGTNPNFGHYKVAPAPVSGGMSFDRVASFQCFNFTKYTLPAECIERTYFTKNTIKLIDAAHHLSTVTGTSAPTSSMLTALHNALDQCRGDEESELAILDLYYLTYGQLTLIRHPNISSRPPPANDEDYVPTELYEMYTVTEDGPNGYRLHYSSMRLENA